VTDKLSGWICRLGTQSLVRRALCLFVWFAAYLGLALPVGWLASGRLGTLAAALAAGVCLLAGWLALLATAAAAPPDKPAAHVLLGMMVRMSLPLLVCLIITRQDNALARAGFAWYLVGAFLWGLALETAISVSQLAVAGPRGKMTSTSHPSSGAPGASVVQTPSGP
jgi:hypothetical protein